MRATLIDSCVCGKDPFKMMRLLPVIFLLAACGQSGALYLPEQSQAPAENVEKPVSAESMDAEEEKEESNEGNEGAEGRP